MSGRKRAPRKGFSHMDWVLLNQRAKNMVTVDEGESPTDGEYTLADVAQHSSKYDAWMAFRGKVYDVTKYVPYHPGGEESLMRGVGTDATALFNEYHKWVNGHYLLKRCCLGALIPEPARDAGEADEREEGEEVAWAGHSILMVLKERRKISTSAFLLRFTEIARRGDKGEAADAGSRQAGCFSHISLRATLGGIVVVRPYTILSYGPTYVEIAVKVYPKGAMSQWLCQGLALEASVSAGAPLGQLKYHGQGLFSGLGDQRCATPSKPGQDVPPRRHFSRVAMVAGGSGVTPMVSFIRAVLGEVEGEKTVASSSETKEESARTEVPASATCETVPHMTLVVANRTEEDIMMRAELEDSAQRLAGLLKIVFVITRPQAPSEAKHAAGIAGAAHTLFVHGRLDSTILAEHLPQVRMTRRMVV